MGAPIVHLEFKSADFDRTAAFYAKLFDWRTEKNASSSYMKLDSSDGPSGGWVRADLVQAPGPIAYLTVDDLPAKLAEVEKAGGRILVHSLPFAGGGEVGLFADPDGNVLGLWRRKAGAPGARRWRSRSRSPRRRSRSCAARPPPPPWSRRRWCSP